jgi:hypothetical protein
MNYFAIADDGPDLDYALEVLSAAGIEASADGSRIGGYMIYATDPNRAQSVISQSHRFRTGDLHVFFLQHPRVNTRQLHDDDLRRYHEWRLGLRTQGRMVEHLLAPDDRDPRPGPRRAPGEPLSESVPFPHPSP